MGKGGVYGSFILVELKGGTSQKYKEDGSKETNITGTTSPKSSLVYVKQPIAEYFKFPEATKARVMELSKRKVETKINGKAVTINTTVSSGATGASRSITVKFTKLVKIGGKDVASVKVAMPSSHTFGDMVKQLSEGANNEFVAAIVSPDGKSTTFKTPYKNGGAGKPKLRR